MGQDIQWFVDVKWDLTYVLGLPCGRGVALSNGLGDENRRRGTLASGTQVQVYRWWMTSENTAWAPDSCTLPTVERPVRQAEFDDLFRDAVRSVERITATHVRLGLAGPVDLEAQVRDLAERESSCCSFFGFTVTAPHAGAVALDITVDPPHVDVLDGLARRAVEKRWVA